MARLPVLALSALVALAIAACGGEDGLSVDEYRAEAREICVQAERATEAIEQPTRSTPAAIVDYLERLADANERTLRRLEGLEPPEELADPHDEIVAANREGQRLVRQVIGDLQEGEQARQVLEESTSRLRELGQRSNAAAEQLGVRECVQ